MKLAQIIYQVSLNSLRVKLWYDHNPSGLFRRAYGFRELQCQLALQLIKSQ